MKSDDFKQCLASLKDKYHDLYIEYKISESLMSLNKVPSNRIHSYRLDSLADKFDQILEKYNKKTRDELRKIVLLECVMTSWNDIFSDKYPESIQIQFVRNLGRFMAICNREQGWGEYTDDVYWKDLGIARQQLFPAGPIVVEAYSGFGFKQGLSRHLFQSISFLKLLLISGGRRGYYQIHTHTQLLSEFNEKGWVNAYTGIAEMLIKYRNIKGVFGAAWFRDPQVAKISPRLTYLHKTPSENGAKLFYAGDDFSGNAFAKSKTRLKLYNEGKYVPKSYLMIWPRKELIAWAAQFIKDK